MKPKQQTFTVQFDINVVTGVEITAESFEDALVKARKFGTRDLVEFDSDYIDGSIEVTGVFK